MAGLQQMSRMHAHLYDVVQGYQLSEYEMMVFVPCLIEKAGHNQVVPGFVPDFCILIHLVPAIMSALTLKMQCLQMLGCMRK